MSRAYKLSLQHPAAGETRLTTEASQNQRAWVSAPLTQQPSIDTPVEIVFQAGNSSKKLSVPRKELACYDVAWLTKAYCSWMSANKLQCQTSFLVSCDKSNSPLVNYLLTKPKAHLGFLPEKITLKSWTAYDPGVGSSDRSGKKGKAVEYEDISFIGQGGFSDVFLARRRKDGVFVAIKQIQKGLYGSTEVEKHMALGERSNMLNLRSPFIVNLISSFQTKHHYYLIMDYKPCGSLKQFIRRSKSLSEEEIRHILCELIAAIDFIHRTGYVLRDLKSDNVLLDENGHVYLCDMGLACRGPSKGKVLKLHCGTPDYMSPEMLLRKGYSYAIDYYSLGIIAYELSEGKTPFSRNMYSEDRILNEEPVITSARSKELKDFISLLTKKDPNTRLGAQQGSAELLAHPWLKGVDFEAYTSRKNAVPSTFLSLLKYSAGETCSENQRRDRKKITADQIIENLSGFSVATILSDYDDSELDEALKNEFDKSPEADRTSVDTWNTNLSPKKRIPISSFSTAFKTDTWDNLESKDECEAKFTARDDKINIDSIKMDNYNFGKFLKTTPFPTRDR